jgi:hypothetical protein
LNAISYLSICEHSECESSDQERSVFLTKYYSGDQVKKAEVSTACSTNGESRGAYRVLVGKPEGRKPLGKPRLRWEDNIKIDLREVEWGSTDWIDLVRDRDRWRALVNAAMNHRDP